MALPSGHSDSIAEGIAAKILAGAGAGGGAGAGAKANPRAAMDVVNRVPFLNPEDVHSLGVIVIMATWCGHCKALKPRLEAARQHLDAHGAQLQFDVYVQDAENGVDLPSFLKGDVEGFPTLLPSINRVPQPFDINHSGSAADLVETLRAAFPAALKDVPPLKADGLAGGFVADATPGFSPVEMSPLFGGAGRRGRRRRTRGARRVGFSTVEAEAKTFDPEDPSAPIEGGGVLRTIGARLARIGAPSAAAEPAKPSGLSGPSGGAVAALKRMPLAARCALVTLARMPADVRAAFGPGAGTVHSAMSGSAADGSHAVVVVLKSGAGKTLIMAGPTPPDGCNTLEGNTSLDAAAADRAVARFRETHDATDATESVRAALV